MTFPRLQPGGPLVVKADVFNGAMAAGEEFIRRGGNTPARGGVFGSLLRDGQVWVRNDSGADAERFHAVSIGATIFPVTGNEDSIVERTVLSAGEPTAEQFGRFAICAEPIASGEIGRVWIRGVCLAVVDIDDINLPYADIQTADTGIDSSHLRAGLAGNAAIVGKPESPGDGQTLCVLLQERFSDVYTAVLTEDLEAGQSAGATVALWDETSVSVTAYDRWLDAGKMVVSESEVRIYWDRVALKWYLDLTKCVNVVNAT